ncbi:hypothetical protein GGP98_001715 [Salinibacter ruber]|nr:hypothetical protein [Salinibacter ruber]
MASTPLTYPQGPPTYGARLSLPQELGYGRSSLESGLPDQSLRTEDT